MREKLRSKDSMPILMITKKWGMVNILSPEVSFFQADSQADIDVGKWLRG